ncbi:glycosyltransferase [Lapidilactobacillus wuchangensis]|uniref:glycosyltransferase n=1 Tax=Lapidilactobacillus wuchangensis TaxID=2486001 RepID=UPI000F7AF7BD|nr:glycosyltransferase [Lapidilactobacillus wuchangensis]
MNILYCGDNKMATGLELSVLSLMAQTQEPLHIYVLTATITTASHQFQPLAEQPIALLQAKLQARHDTSEIIKIDISDLFAATPPTANLATSFTPNCMLRLYADQVTLLPERLLYLDTDVLCCQDFQAFYQQDFAGNDLVGVLDHYGRWFFHQSWTHLDYLNSGVLLLNLGQIRQNGLFAACRQRCREQRMFMPDQSALNKLARYKKIAPVKFNEQHRRQADTVFQHFTTSFRFFPWFHTVTIKPWQMTAVQEQLGLHDYDDLFQSYHELTASTTKF